MTVPTLAQTIEQALIDRGYDEHTHRVEHFLGFWNGRPSLAPHYAMAEYLRSINLDTPVAEQVGNQIADEIARFLATGSTEQAEDYKSLAQVIAEVLRTEGLGAYEEHAPVLADHVVAHPGAAVSDVVAGYLTERGLSGYANHPVIAKVVDAIVNHSGPAAEALGQPESVVETARISEAVITNDGFGTIELVGKVVDTDKACEVIRDFLLDYHEVPDIEALLILAGLADEPSPEQELARKREALMERMGSSREATASVIDFAIEHGYEV